MKLFLLIGQSNMAGRGEMADVAPLRDERCKMFRQGCFQPMMEPIHIDRPVDTITYGIGPGASFAVECASFFQEEIGLIPCAMGGSALSRWMPGAELYDYAIAHARLASRFGELAGILWHQGETDAENDALTDTYGSRLSEMIASMRRDLQTSVPFVLGEISDFTGNVPNVARINAQIVKVARAHENCGVVSAEGLTSKPDLLHYDSVSQREFGRRYFQMYRALLAQNG